MSVEIQYIYRSGSNWKIQRRVLIKGNESGAAQHLVGKVGNPMDLGLPSTARMIASEGWDWHDDEDHHLIEITNISDSTGFPNCELTLDDFVSVVSQWDSWT